MKQINSLKEFQSIIQKGYTLVDFYTTWCGPCKMLAPIIDEVSKLFTDIQFIKIDVDQASEIATVFAIQSIPTIYLFKNGNPVNHFSGYVPKENLIQFIRQNKK